MTQQFIEPTKSQKIIAETANWHWKYCMADRDGYFQQYRKLFAVELKLKAPHTGAQWAELMNEQSRLHRVLSGIRATLDKHETKTVH